MSSNSSEDFLAYTQRQATRIARADEPWTELMSAAFEAFRGEEGAGDGDADDGPVAEDADAVAADVDAGGVAGRAISLPKRLGALALLAVATVLKERAQSWVQSQRGDSSVDPESVQIYDERSDGDAADEEDETADAEADEESSGSSGGRLLKTVAVVALLGVAVYAFTKKRGGSDEFDEFDDYEYDDDGVDVDDYDDDGVDVDDA